MYRDVVRYICFCAVLVCASIALGLNFTTLKDYTERTCYVIKHSQITTPTFVEYKFTMAVTTHLIDLTLKAVTKAQQDYYEGIIEAKNCSCYFRNSRRDSASLVLKSPPPPEGPQLGSVYVLVSFVIAWILFEVYLCINNQRRLAHYYPYNSRCNNQLSGTTAQVCSVCYSTINRNNQSGYYYHRDCWHLVHPNCMPNATGKCQVCPSEVHNQYQAVV